MRVCAVILAGGAGVRMGHGVPKQKIEILGESILKRTLLAFEKNGRVDSIVVVGSNDTLDFVRGECYGLSKVKKIVVGGKNRVESARCGFLAIDFPCDLVAVHDGVRCLVSQRDIDTVIDDAIKYGAATASTPVTDTVKAIDSQGNIVSTVDRDSLRAVQTPQIFKYELYKRAMECLDTSDLKITDDNSLMEKIGVKVHPSDTSKYNIKITYSEDLELAKFILEGGLSK